MSSHDDSFAVPYVDSDGIPVPTPRGWLEMLEYERVDVVKALNAMISLNVFANDDIRCVEISEAAVVSSSPTVGEVHVYELTMKVAVVGTVGYTRRELFLMVLRRARQTLVSDLVSRVSFGVQPRDPLPGLMMVPFVETARLRAVKAWTRVAIALHCGTIKRMSYSERRTCQHVERLERLLRNSAHGLVDCASDGSSDAQSVFARLFDDMYDEADECQGLPSRGNASSTTAGHSAALQRPRPKARQAPQWMYNQSFEESRVDLRHLARNRPVVVVVWASWDVPSVEWLREHIFNGGCRQSTALAARGASRDTRDPKASQSRGGGRSGPPPPADEVDADSELILGPFANFLRTDPWLQVVRQFVGRDLLHGMRVQRPTGWSKPWSQTDSRERRKKKKGKTNGAKNTVSEDFLRMPCSSTHARIVLVSVDDDRQAAARALAQMDKEGMQWRSTQVDLVSLWAGEGGLQSEFATQFNVSSLPFIAVTSPSHRSRCTPDSGPSRSSSSDSTLRSSDSGCTSCWPRFAPPAVDAVVFRETSRGERETKWRRVGAMTTAQRMASPAHEPPVSSTSGAHRCLWHELPHDVRERVLRGVASAATSSDAPLSFHAMIENTFPSRWQAGAAIVTMAGTRAGCAEGGHLALTRLPMPSNVLSSVTLTGVASRELVDGPLLEPLEVLKRLRADCASIDVVCVEPSRPILTSFSELTPAIDQKYDAARFVLCSHCNTAVCVAESAHFRCFHCPQGDGVVCMACFDTDRHAPHHHLARMPPGITESTSVFWGPDNINPLPTFDGVLYTRCATPQHHDGVVCSECMAPVIGRRWRCLHCYCFDLCDFCAAAPSAGLPATSPWLPQREAVQLPLKARIVPGKQSAAVAATEKPLAKRFHDADSHILMCTRYVPFGPVSGFLQPQCAAARDFTSLHSWNPDTSSPVWRHFIMGCAQGKVKGAKAKGGSTSKSKDDIENISNPAVKVDHSVPHDNPTPEVWSVKEPATEFEVQPDITSDVDRVVELQSAAGEAAEDDKVTQSCNGSVSIHGLHAVQLVQQRHDLLSYDDEEGKYLEGRRRCPGSSPVSFPAVHLEPIGDACDGSADKEAGCTTSHERYSSSGSYTYSFQDDEGNVHSSSCSSAFSAPRLFHGSPTKRAEVVTGSWEWWSDQVAKHYVTKDGSSCSRLQDLLSQVTRQHEANRSAVEVDLSWCYMERPAPYVLGRLLSSPNAPQLRAITSLRLDGNYFTNVGFGAMLGAMVKGNRHRTIFPVLRELFLNSMGLDRVSVGGIFSAIFPLQRYASGVERGEDGEESGPAIGGCVVSPPAEEFTAAAMAMGYSSEDDTASTSPHTAADDGAPVVRSVGPRESQKTAPLMPSLRVLSLSDNPGLGSDGMGEVLRHMIANHHEAHTLDVLDVSRCSIDCRGAGYLREYFQHLRNPYQVPHVVVTTSIVILGNLHGVSNEEELCPPDDPYISVVL